MADNNDALQALINWAEGELEGLRQGHKNPRTGEIEEPEIATEIAYVEQWIAEARQRVDALERLLWEVDATARYRGDEYGVPDCIDNHGQPYQSQHLCCELQAIDRRMEVKRRPPCPKHTTGGGPCYCGFTDTEDGNA